MNRNLPSKPLLAGLLITALAAFGIRLAAAGRDASQPAQVSPLHPAFALLDANGENVLTGNQPLSTMQTCGQCHDTGFIVQHSYHADLGLSEWTTAGSTGSGRAWDTSAGIFGKWDPLTYRYLSPAGDERLDLGTPAWLMLYANRLVGGAPATTSRQGEPLDSLPLSKEDPETAILNPQGTPSLWNWNQSGVVEMNCFLCHLATPNNAARIEAIRAGDFGAASTATLLGTGIVEKTVEGWQWNPAAFDDDGELAPQFVAIQDPSNDNCAQCHGLVHGGDTPLVLTGCGTEYSQTAATGQIISPQKISESGMNISGKETLNRSWDIHAERQVLCTDCHFSLNNPIYAQLSPSDPSYLLYDPRRLEIGEYLQRPVHDFARGQSAQFTVAPENKATMRRCESCHSTQLTHADWLPYVERHMEEVACETCHIPQMYAPAIQSYDWTVLTLQGEPVTVCRGAEGEGLTDLVEGYQPALLMRRNVDGKSMLAPYNLITVWYWVYDDANSNTRPVRLTDLETVYFKNGRYDSEILAAFDADKDGNLEKGELIVDTPEKEAAVAIRLAALELGNPRIVGEMDPYSINHDVAGGKWAIRDCQTCHDADSRITQPIKLAEAVPGGVAPTFVQDANVNASGQLFTDEGGALYYQAITSKDSIYIFGHDRARWIDTLGLLLFLGTLAGIAGHSGIRASTAMRQPKRAHEPKLKKVYMYNAYGRFWHWLQTVAIILLLFTGLVIHRPDLLGAFSFRNMVTVHNILATILAVNAVFSLFYHLTTGEIRQFIPRPYGFFDQAIVQAKFYLSGIFRGDPHPFEKTPQKKLNPLQQITYFMILNVLLPIQGLSGILMWGAQKWPVVANWVGGLTILAPIHTISAWLFTAFLAIHLYLLTTAGRTATTSIRAMVTGWEDVEVHEVHAEVKTKKAKRAKK
ncbi:MAG: cytochrome b/b6 domain-containing protein [Chloroflexi bacterium]|nr:cytochrome b/b6 domain-containing protein [Chloroflexota bacterium]